MTPCAKQQGYMILELLMSLQLGATVMIAAVVMLGMVIRLNADVGHETKMLMQMEKMFQVFREDIESVVDYDFSGSYPDRRAFEGSENSMSFLKDNGKGLEEIVYRIGAPEAESLSSGKCVMERSARDIKEYFSSRRILAKEKSEEIFAGLCGELKFRYVRENASDRSIIWESEWQVNELPALVGIRFPANESRLPERKNVEFLFLLPIRQSLKKR